MLGPDVGILKTGCDLHKAIPFLWRRGAAPAHCRAGGPIPGRGLLLLGILAGATGALAQGVLAPSSANFDKSTYAPSLPGYQTGGVPQFAEAIPQTLGLMQWGVADLHPHLEYQLIYGDGIPATPTNHVTTVVQTISPGFQVNLGAHWTLDYDASMHFYSSRQFSDETDQSVRLNGKAQYEDWGFGLSQAYIYSDSPLAETEAQTETSGYMTMLTASREMGSRLSAQFSLDQTITSSSQISGSTNNNSQGLDSWVLSSGLYYQTDYRLVAGINASAGYDSISPGGDMEFEQLQGTLSWQVLGKLSVTGSAGMELSQMMGSQLLDPTFSAAINYQPFQNTSASLIASRTVSPSFYQDEVTETTMVSATFRQRFLQYFNFDVSGGYSTTPFVGFATQGAFLNNQPAGAPLLAANLQQNRTDVSRFIRVSVGSTFRQRGSVSVFYSFGDTSSSLTPFALTTTQVGFEVGWHY
jgi:hypothetical protein